MNGFECGLCEEHPCNCCKVCGCYLCTCAVEKTMTRKEAKAIVNDLIENVYCGQPRPKKWDIQFGRNPWFSLGVHFDHKDPSFTFHLPGFLIYIGNCEQPGLRFWNEMAYDAVQKHIS